MVCNAVDMKKQKTAHIYLILFPNGCKYVGQTTDLKERKRRYKKHDCVDQRKLYAHLCKYGFKTCKFILLEDISDISLLNEREIFWIKQFNSFSGNNKKQGLNLTLGGAGNKGQIWSEEKRKKMSERVSGEKNPNFGKKHTAEARLAISRAHLGHTRSRGRIQTEEAKEKNRQAHLGKPSWCKGLKMSDDFKRKLSMKKSSLIIDTFTGVYYLGLKEAAYAKGINFNTLKWYLGKNTTATKNPTSLKYA